MDFKNLVEYQNLMQKRLRQEQKVEKQIDLLSIINQLTSGPKNIVQKEQIILEASQRGISEKETIELLDRLIKENIVYESMPGYIKKR